MQTSNLVYSAFLVGASHRLDVETNLNSCMMIDMGKPVVVLLGSLMPNTMQPKSLYPQPDKGRLTGQHHATQVHIYPAQQCQEIDFVYRLFSDWLLAMSHKPRRKMLTTMGLPGETAPHWLFKSSWPSEPTGLWFEETKRALTAFN